MRISVWNAGSLLPEDQRPADHIGLGLDLVRGIATQQFNGTFTLEPHNGGTLAEVTIDEHVLIGSGMQDGAGGVVVEGSQNREHLARSTGRLGS